jgi:hypothetical protein
MPAIVTDGIEIPPAITPVPDGQVERRRARRIDDFLHSVYST